jgi:hypothetical protein
LLVGQRFRSYSEARLWEQSVLDAIGSNVAKIASGVLRDTTGQSLSRPVFRRTFARSTADLLNLVIVR